MIRRLIPLIVTVGTTAVGLVAHCVGAARTDKKLRRLGEEIQGKVSLGKEKFLVTEFMDQDGEIVVNLEAATMVIATSEKGYSLPFKKEELFSKIALGDYFYREVRITRD